MSVVEVAALDDVHATALSVLESRPAHRPCDTARVVSISRTRAEIADELGLAWPAPRMKRRARPRRARLRAKQRGMT